MPKSDVAVARATGCRLRTGSAPPDVADFGWARSAVLQEPPLAAGQGVGPPPCLRWTCAGLTPRLTPVFPIVRRGTPFPGILQRAIPSADVAENPIPSITCSDADFLYKGLSKLIA